MKKLLSIVLLCTTCIAPRVFASPQPLIFDTDHGPFIDDIYALGLLLNSRDLIDLKLIMGTSNQPDLSAICIAAQLNMSGISDIPVVIGEKLPPYEDRGGMCAIPGIMGFGIESACKKVYNSTHEAGVIQDGVEYAAKLIEDSGKNDWWYLVVGGQTSLKRLILEFPEAASKIDTLVVMGGKMMQIELKRLHHEYNISFAICPLAT
jgi:inosine-uridine nucleoside N-ribohydrolase